MANKHNLTTAALLCSLLPVACIAMPTSDASTDGASQNEQAYTDSVFGWGAWELDVEPAAGGAATGGSSPILPRNARVVVRTNSTSAVAPKPPATVPPLPELPVAPTPPPTPSVPSITPISPSVTPPVGGPSDGF